MIDELQAVFEANKKDGTVDFDYETEVYYGQFGNEVKLSRRQR